MIQIDSFVKYIHSQATEEAVLRVELNYQTRMLSKEWSVRHVEASRPPNLVTPATFNEWKSLQVGCAED